MTINNKKIFSSILAVCFCALTASQAIAQETFDIVIEDGRVMDPETGLDSIRNVGIRGGTIAKISEEDSQGRTIINAGGLVVAPGFIDLHAHGQSGRANEFQAMDGVTTALELEGGVIDIPIFLALREKEAVLNYGASISHGDLRTMVMPEHTDNITAALDVMRESGEINEDSLNEIGDAFNDGRNEALDPDQYPALWSRLEQGLNDGALGVGMPHQYYPGVTYDEVFRLFQFASEQDVPIYTHVRDMGVAPMQEVVANAVATGASLHIVHMNSSSLWDYQTNLDLILGAQERGADITTEAYPYTAASTGIRSAIFDPGWEERL